MPRGRHSNRARLASKAGVGEQTFGIYGSLDEIATQDAQREDFLVDLGGGADAEPAEQGQRRAPAAQRVLDEKSRYCRGQQQEASVDEESETESEQCHGARVRLQGAFDVPFALEFGDALVE